MSSYTSEYPAGVQIDPEYKAFFERFYQISDTPDAHDEYVKQFTADAKLTMASKKASGSDEILGVRKGMWEKVSSRNHKPIKIFPFGSGADEVMLYGTVDYVLKDGKKASVDWSARAHLVKEGGAVKMDFYQVYLDTAAQQQAK
ncbi:hypothetical protein AAFC00_007166 [Neodothiora populina]|uniref:Fungal specific transcription factor n=1 Tax=Neodothiora populina TaxID=2781224 RepID=A0ABR3PIK5_9PEZI